MQFSDEGIMVDFSPEFNMIERRQIFWKKN